MNIEDYISSGVLECYVLGQLSRIEAAKVEEIATRYPEVRKEINAIEESLEQYADAHAKTPLAGAKEKFLAQLEVKTPEAKVVQIYKTNKTATYFAAASTIFALMFGIAALYYFNEWQLAESKITALIQDSEKISSYNTVVNQQLKEEISTKDNFLTMLRDTSTQAVQLKGLPLSPTSAAVVFWNKHVQSVYIDVKNLPAPPADKQYQLWALKDGVPFDAGVFEVSASSISLQKMKAIDAAQAFAVTLESKGGSPTPTMDQMFLIGNIQSL